MSTADAPTSKRLHLRGVDKDTLPKVIRAIAPSQPWRAACMEYARRTDYGERTHESLRTSDLAPVLRLLLQAVEQNVTFGGTASIQDLAKLGCPGALLSVVEMQVKKAAKRSQDRNTGETSARTDRRPTTNPRNLSRRKTTTGPKGAIVAGQGTPTTMSVFSVRRVKVLERTDTMVKFRVDGITGGEDGRLPFDVHPNQPLGEQVRQLELRAKLTFVPEGRVLELVRRELQSEPPG